jgi:hypothetical protein
MNTITQKPTINYAVVPNTIRSTLFRLSYRSCVANWSNIQHVVLLKIHHNEKLHKYTEILSQKANKDWISFG